VVRGIFEGLGLDPDASSPGREVVHDIGASVVKALNWERSGQVTENIKGDRAKVLRTAYEEVEGDEDEHLYHGMGWGREL
jgi:hypothetical protein